jgi:hypothetical protein
LHGQVSMSNVKMGVWLLFVPPARKRWRRAAQLGAWVGCLLCWCASYEYLVEAEIYTGTSLSPVRLVTGFGLVYLGFDAGRTDVHSLAVHARTYCWTGTRTTVNREDMNFISFVRMWRPFEHHKERWGSPRGAYTAWVVVPWWCLATVASFLLVPLLTEGTRRMLRYRRGACICCGYDLAHSQSERCSECGGSRQDAGSC